MAVYVVIYDGKARKIRRWMGPSIDEMQALSQLLDQLPYRRIGSDMCRPVGIVYETGHSYRAATPIPSVSPEHETSHTQAQLPEAILTKPSHRRRRRIAIPKEED